MIKDFKFSLTFDLMSQIYFMESGITMNWFSEKLFKKLDSGENLDNHSEIMTIFDESIKNLPKKFSDLAEQLNIVFIGNPS